MWFGPTRHPQRLHYTPPFRSLPLLLPTGMLWCFSVVQLCLTLCDPVDCSTPGFPILHRLPELAQTHVHWASDAIQPSRSLSSPSPAFCTVPLSKEPVGHPPHLLRYRITATSSSNLSRFPQLKLISSTPCSQSICQESGLLHVHYRLGGGGFLEALGHVLFIWCKEQ